MRLVAGPGILLRQTSSGTIVSAAGSSPVSISAPAAFFHIFKDPDGHTMLQGGSVTGGHGGSATIDHILVIDAESGLAEAAGIILYIVANVSATIEDGLMLPGATLNSATTATAAELPDNHSFTIGAPTGDLHYEIGRWTATGFLPAGPGNMHAMGCPGNFRLERI